MKSKLKILLFCLISVSLIGCDRITKVLARDHLMNKDPIVYLNDSIRLEYVENTGAFLSLGEALPQTISLLLLSVIPVIILLILFIYVIRKSGEMSLLKMTAFAMIFAGGVGNIGDRIFYKGHVADFINVGLGGLRTGIFNIADVLITSGVAILLLLYSLPKKDPIK